MVKASSLSLLALAEAALYGFYEDLHCYEGHGGTPLDPTDMPLSNVSQDLCESHCDSSAGCIGFSFKVHGKHWYNPGDCYFRSALDAAQCDSKNHSGWSTYVQVSPPPLKGNMLYHLFEPKYTGVQDRDAGDFKGDASFIFETFSAFEKTNPEASMDHNIIEMSEIDVTGWGGYEECNAPGASGMFTCPEDSPRYCCTTHDPSNRSHNIPAKHTRDQLPGLEVAYNGLGPEFGLGGFWMSFPAESENVTWTQRLRRRIAGKCMGDAWRKDAGGCAECGEALDQCVASCIKAALCVNGSLALLQQTWDRVFADPNECPEVPLPSREHSFPNGMEDVVVV